MSVIKPLVAGNWKMNGLVSSLQQIELLKQAVQANSSVDKADIMVCPPATLIMAGLNAVQGTSIMIGAQDCHTAKSGAHTGDISAEMISDVGAKSVILGHSERRADHGERDQETHQKALAVHEENLIAIICVGETAGQRKTGMTLDIVKRQLKGSVPVNSTAANTVIAYEPVWAIGTGLTPTVEDVAEVHKFIRAELINIVGMDTAQGMRILYGGSVKPANAAELMAIDNVNGALVGGASLKAEDFMGIISVYN